MIVVIIILSLSRSLCLSQFLSLSLCAVLNVAVFVIMDRFVKEPAFA